MIQQNMLPRSNKFETEIMEDIIAEIEARGTTRLDLAGKAIGHRDINKSCYIADRRNAIVSILQKVLQDRRIKIVGYVQGKGQIVQYVGGAC